MTNSGFSSTVPSWNTYEEEEEDDDCEFFDAEGTESPEPSFVFKFEYQTREMLEKNSTSCLFDESQNGSSSCDSVEAKGGAFEEEEEVKRVVIEETQVVKKGVKFGCVVSDEMSLSGDEKVATSYENDVLVTSEEFDSGSICSMEDEDVDELGALENIGLRKPNGFDEEDDEDDELWEVIGLRKPDGFDDKDGDTLDGADTSEALCQQLKSVDKMKMELRKARATTGLPTIPEESEYVNMNDMKPLKIVDVYQNKVYKSYKTQMRKLDVLNHAIGDLKSKRSLKSFSSHKIKSFFSNLRLCRSKIDCDPVNDVLISELEVVYVGQLCLSWECLKLQYEKALELLESSPNRKHSYNEVAQELQQFQVLLQRFVEDEQFKGPRVENYVKSRYALPKLLQVPEIREDILVEGKEGSVPITDIVEMLRDSIRTMWRFIRADKNANISTACRKRSLPSPLDSELLEQVQADLRNKERIRKELKSSQNRIIKRFRKHEGGEEDEDSEDHSHLNFFNEVDIRLVSRVLNMSAITKDRLVWCQSTLSKIQFVRSKRFM